MYYNDYNRMNEEPIVTDAYKVEAVPKKKAKGAAAGSPPVPGLRPWWAAPWRRGRPLRRGLGREQHRPL